MYRDEIENYIGQLEKSRNTCESYRRDLMQMEEFLCNTQGTGPDDYARSIVKTKATSSVARIYSAMNGFFRYLMLIGKIDTNPIEGITAPKVVKNPRPVFDEIRKSELVTSPRGYSNKAVRDRAMLGVMFDTGYKVTKLIGLKLSDVNTLALMPETKSALEDYIYGTREQMLCGTKSDILFTNCNGKPMSRQGFWKMMKRYTDGTV